MNKRYRKNRRKKRREAERFSGLYMIVQICALWRDRLDTDVEFDSS